MNVQLIIIGAGPGGYETALYAAEKGLSVLIVEANKPGGTCLNEGCIPTKAFCKNAEVIDTIRQSACYGICNLHYEFDFSKVVERKNDVVAFLVSGVEFLLKHKNITYLQGKASLVDAHSIEVNGEIYTAEHIIISTGSVSKSLPIEGADLPGVLTSKEILEMDHLPSRLCVIGGGVIGMEFASIFQRMGSEVTVIEYAKEILPNFDMDISKRLKQTLSKKGITIQTQSAVQYIRQGNESYVIGYANKKGETFEVVADTVLMAVGREPNLSSLDLDAVSIAYTPKGIITNENMQTSIPSIYAIGDINGRCLLAHAATFQGIHVINHLLGIKDDLCLDQIPSAVFTSPEVATAGFTEEQCKEQGIVYRIQKSFFRSNGKAVTMNETEGLCKVIVNECGEIIGCHLIGPHVSDLIHEMNVAIRQSLPLSRLQEIVHIHPTLSEIFIK